MERIQEKINNNDTSAGKLFAEEYNQSPAEVANQIANFSDLTKDDLKQLSKSIDTAIKSQLYEDIGDANGVILTRSLPKENLEQFTDKSIYMFKANTANTGATTIKIASQENKPLKTPTNEELPANFLIPNEIYLCYYDKNTDIYLLFQMTLPKATTEEAIAGVNEEKAITPKTNQDHYDSKTATDEEVLAGSSTDKHITPKQFARFGAFESGLNYQRDVIEDGIIRIGSIAELLMLPQILGFENMMHRKVLITLDNDKPYSYKNSITKFSNGSTYNFCDKDLRDTPHYGNVLSHPFVILAQGVALVYNFADMSCTTQYGPGFLKEWTIDNSTNEIVSTAIPNITINNKNVEGPLSLGGGNRIAYKGEKISSVPVLGNYYLPNENEKAITDLYGSGVFIRHFVGTITNVSFKTDQIEGNNPSQVGSFDNFYEIEFDIPPCIGPVVSMSSDFFRYLAAKTKLTLRIGLNYNASVTIGENLPKSYLFNYKEILNRYTSWPDSVSYNYQQLPSNKRIGLLTGNNFGTEINPGSSMSNMLGEISLFVSSKARLGRPHNIIFGSSLINTNSFYGITDGPTAEKSGNFIHIGFARNFPVGHIYPDLETLKTYSWYDESLAVEV